MRPSWCWLLSALLAFGLGGGGALALDFHDPISGWSMTLPPGWTAMAEDEKAGIVEALKGEGVRRVNLVAAFRLSDADLPYLLATEHHVKNASLERVAKSAGAGRAKFADRAELGEPAIHEAMKMVLIESRSEELQSLVALFPGRDVVVELTVFLAADAPESDFATFRGITSSFRFDAGRGYAPKSDAFPDSFTKLLLLCCGVVAVRLILAKRRGERRRPGDRLEPEGSPERP
jgi:hypothetical protein